MARNKYPEQTVQKILDAAAELFLTKGYDDTSLQDILNRTKLSKGAIYHHFASKEAIFEALCEMMCSDNEERLGSVRDDPALNGAQKLQKLFRLAVLQPNQTKVLRMMPYLVDSPRLLASHLRELFTIAVPDYIKPILDEGAADGSLRVANTKEIAEVLMLMTDIWMHPLLMPNAPEEMGARCRVFTRIAQELLGIPLFDEEMIERYTSYSGMVRDLREQTQQETPGGPPAALL